jgi:NAD+ synthase (glutamine-hydrolysing)
VDREIEADGCGSAGVKAMRLALAQINPTVGDVRGNAELISTFIDRAAKAGADLVVFPELAICGYPPRDLLLSEGFVEACAEAAGRLAKKTGGRGGRAITVVVGCPMRAGGKIGAGVTNSLLVLSGGKVSARYDKRLLPTYDVFDEDRYFKAGTRPVVIRVKGAGDRRVLRVGLSICEDLWGGEDVGFSERYRGLPDPIEELAARGIDLLVNPSASPFVLGKGMNHRKILAKHARKHGIVVASVNQVGGNDELIFDGHAAVLDAKGRVVAAGPGFEESLVVCDVGAGVAKQSAVVDPVGAASHEEMLFGALVLGVRDYCRKTGFSSAILGLSGGIDSALTACIAAAALGAERVVGVAMPGPYSSEHSRTDAEELARRLGMPLRMIPIGGAMDGLSAALNDSFRGASLRTLGETLPDLTEENLQSRIRGTLLMGLSNRTGSIVLTTGNKSEMAVGYCTLYGDMNGGLAVLSDVTKQQVYALSRFVNGHFNRLGFVEPPIPLGSIEKPPSAELRPNQTDQDSLPPYEVLDRIIELYVEQRRSAATIVRKTGFDAAVVKRITALIDRSEYKRKQAATGLKVTSVAFGSGRRVPIAQGWVGPS